MDRRIGPHFLKASVGFGGSCFKKDILNLVYLCKYYGLEEVADYWFQVLKINDYQKKRFSTRIIDSLGGDLNGKNITLLGWAFKANTNDSRESAAIYVAEDLFKAGAKIEVYDPMVSYNAMLNDIEFYWRNPPEKENLLKQFKSIDFPKNFNESDAAVILTECDEFKSMNYGSVSIFDGRYILKK